MEAGAEKLRFLKKDPAVRVYTTVFFVQRKICRIILQILYIFNLSILFCSASVSFAVDTMHQSLPPTNGKEGDISGRHLPQHSLGTSLGTVVKLP